MSILNILTFGKVNYVNGVKNKIQDALSLRHEHIDQCLPTFLRYDKP